MKEIIEGCRAEHVIRNRGRETAWALPASLQGLAWGLWEILVLTNR